jgi:hypothetical protein
MEKEYIIPFPNIPNFKVPKLYRVNVSVEYYSECYYWLIKNCRDKFYVSREVVEFEDSRDAMFFSLKWL